MALFLLNCRSIIGYFTVQGDCVVKSHWKKKWIENREKYILQYLQLQIYYFFICLEKLKTTRIIDKYHVTLWISYSGFPLLHVNCCVSMFFLKFSSDVVWCRTISVVELVKEAEQAAQSGLNFVIMISV